jgi:hypothetical protein
LSLLGGDCSDTLDLGEFRNWASNSYDKRCHISECSRFYHDFLYHDFKKYITFGENRGLVVRYSRPRWAYGLGSSRLALSVLVFQCFTP